MSNKFLNARLRQPRDSSTNWETANPILLNGERVFVDFYDDNNVLLETKEKIGNGVTSFIDLPYSSVGGSAIELNIWEAND